MFREPTAPTFEMISSPVGPTANVESEIVMDSNRNKDWFSPNFSDKIVAGLFVQKVFAILSFQLAVAFAFCGVCMFIEPVKSYIWDYLAQDNWVLFTVLVFSMAVCVGIFFIISFFNADARTPKLSGILLVLFTISICILLMLVCTRFQMEALFIAIGISCVCSWLISVFKVYGLPYAFGFFVVTCLISSFVTVAVYWAEKNNNFRYNSYNRAYERIDRERSIFEYTFGIAFANASFIMAYFTLDTVVLIKYKFVSPKEYIFATLRLNFDIIYWFLACVCYPCSTLRTGNRGAFLQ